MTSRLIKTVAATLAGAALLAFPLSAYASVTQPTLSEAAVTSVHAPRGMLVSAVPIAALTAAQLDAAAADFPDTPPARYGVTAYRLIYRTVDHNGRPTTASGIVVLPDGRRGALSAVEYLHGTNATKAYAASVDDTSTDRLVTALFAGAGLVGVAPDYLGLGLGPGLHPYIDTKTETTASADLLLAARTFAAQHGVALKRDVLVTGFSQGGRASIALGRALSRGEVGPFRLGALQAVAGPYDLLGSELPATCHDWTPRVPVHLYSGTKDTDVVAANADSCATGLRARGAQVTVHSMGAVDHFGTAFAAYPQIVRAFSHWA